MIKVVTKAKLKTFKLPLLSISLTVILAACNLPGRSSLSTQTTDEDPIGIPTAPYTPPAEIASPIPTPFPPNTPVWTVYKYTCELATGGGTMTMNLNWSDRSDNEEGYRVYRNKKVIATLAPNSTYYVDVVYVAAGTTMSYSIEAFNKDWQASSSTITYGCQ